MAGLEISQGFQNSLWIWSGAILYAREMEKVQITAYAKEAYYIDDNFFIGWGT